MKHIPSTSYEKRGGWTPAPLRLAGVKDLNPTTVGLMAELEKHPSGYSSPVFSPLLTGIRDHL